MKARDVMTRRVISVGPDASVLEAARLMLQNRISGLPVVDHDEKLVGIVTEGDFLRRAETATERKRPRWLEFLAGPGRLASDYVHSHGRKVSEVMTTEPVTITEDTPLDDIVRLMERRQIKRLPVMRGSELVGVVSRANLLHAMVHVGREAAQASPGDSAIAERMRAEMDQQAWAPRALVNVAVHEGVVELWGCVTDEKQRQGLKVMAENIPGVKSVQDNLAWVEPSSGMAFYVSDLETDRMKSTGR
jgi:CBS domain-containing protein